MLVYMSAITNTDMMKIITNYMRADNTHWIFETFNPGSRNFTVVFNVSLLPRRLCNFSNLSTRN